MKISVRLIQIIVGILFIISGLVKANDPLGLSYKMQEFFEIWNQSLGSGSFFAKQILISLFEYLHRHSLLLSVIMIALEIVTGIALLIGWKKKFILYLLLALIVFFTFLTGYALLSKNPDGSPKFTNCGCFGDCLPITPATSFTKDIVLLFMIIFLILGQKYIQPLFSNKLRTTL
ncbi:MAG: MauE/DoxX family redox-associated membrane protein, partial [Flavisolibacter sp.]